MRNNEWLERTNLLLGNSRLDLLHKSNVLVIGLGGVGAYAAENICRAGVGKMTIADGDIIQKSNINRQLPALNSTVGEWKSDLLAARLHDINPDLKLRTVNSYLKDDGMDELIESEEFDYVVDAIDTLSPKTFLIYKVLRSGIPLVSSMGAGGKTDPSQVLVDDISRSHSCRLAYILRKRLRRLGVNEGFKVVFSTEQVNPESVEKISGERNKKTTVGTISYMPPLFGCYCASVVIRGITGLQAD